MLRKRTGLPYTDSAKAVPTSASLEFVGHPPGTKENDPATEALLVRGLGPARHLRLVGGRFFVFLLREMLREVFDLRGQVVHLGGQVVDLLLGRNAEPL